MFFVSEILMQHHFCRWLFPFIGHMGIATTQGVIRDFAGPYFVSVGMALLFKDFLRSYCAHQRTRLHGLTLR